MFKTVALLSLVAFGAAYAAEKDMSEADHKAMMEKMQPGPEHKMLAKLAGNWEVASKWWMDPEKPPMESKGSSTFTVIYDGRFVRQDFKGEMMGQAFTGVGYDGFDNVTKKYTSFWLDSMGTSMFKVDGTSKDDGKTIEYTGEASCPMANGTAKTRWVHKAVSDDSFIFEMYMAPKGTEVKSGELTYTRKK